MIRYRSLLAAESNHRMFEDPPHSWERIWERFADY